MRMGRNTYLSDIVRNRLPKVYKAVISYIRLTGTNPALVYELDCKEGRTVELEFRAPLRPSEQAEDHHQAMIDCLGEDRLTLHDYIRHGRPQIVERLKSKGRASPERLFLTRSGEPISNAGFQKALLTAMTKPRLPEVIGPIGSVRCVPSFATSGDDITSGPDSRRCYPCVSRFAESKDRNFKAFQAP